MWQNSKITMLAICFFKNLMSHKVGLLFALLELLLLMQYILTTFYQFLVTLAKYDSRRKTLLLYKFIVQTLYFLHKM